MDHTHDHLHRRQARAAFPDPAAIASAAAAALAEAFGQPEPTPDASPQQTITSVVYYTQPKTFTGAIGGYTTMGVVDPPNTSAPSTSKTQPTTAPHPNSKSSSINSDTTLRTSPTGLPPSIVPTSSVASTLAIAVASLGASTTSQHSSIISSTASAAKSTSSPSTSSGGMSVAGKAGLAIGILLLLGTALALVLFCFKKRKDAMKAERLDDEKTDMFVGAGRAASTRTTVTAPRLSLRPITQFLPNLGEKRQSRGNVLAMAPPSASQATGPSKNGSAWERPMLSPESNRNNPFGNHAENIDTANANGPAVVDSVGPGGELISGAAAAPVAVAAIGLARGASKRENQPKQIDFTNRGPFRGPPSPAGTEFSMSSDTPGAPTQTPQGAAIAAAGGPTNSAVHRVQLDFKPSMEDELELRAGQLIRMLHEYDDGWALCIRLDRSQQGVVPRTCLSTRPVKPRPQQNGPRGPPPPGMRVPQQGPQGRPMSPAMNQGPPQGQPSGNRPMTPQGRPMTPNGPGPQNPIYPQQGRPRSPSAAQMQGRRNGPPGLDPMNPVAQPDVAGSPPLSRSPPTNGPISRKPVGQAL